ncbi:SDR family NAD(P)-dependent oxidoreductase [Rhodococcus wratislaviensis]|uniref:Putative oxidoreductase n=1 Tax=Rhodococcus wratislaviensis NBRC 100605 TaxID=1219028 RepID=X0Q0S8_RHOWR|nr:SDR family oxidoreductase [Rhodococcus wratislaviensis]GAF49543.1 putative oxidoreductase [Rhodococcus wratislaviensis NBRC 100605]
MGPRFAGRNILLTGAGGGIGAATVARLASEGANVIATDITLAMAQDAIADQPGQHAALAVDVTKEEDWLAAIEQVRASHGHLHGLVNNAAIGSIATVEDETIENWNRVIAVSQTGVWLGMKHCAPALESERSSIVNVCSILGTVGGLGNSAAYHAAKGAVRTLTKNAALHWARTGIRVNSLHPGFVGTSHLHERFGGTERHRAMLAGTPMGRLAEPEEIAGVIAFLLSDDSTYMTGSEVTVDGGWTAA